jgi:hypothetical protein
MPMAVNGDFDRASPALFLTSRSEPGAAARHVRMFENRNSGARLTT